ncbi:hypothetical protein PQQ96_31580 [Paraburkholderia sediminicola]|uniref:hypothetical protein n=1 Tax=Paraburkholderia sediminicola TaxID=458836 RepID=UPI0038B9EA45
MNLHEQLGALEMGVDQLIQAVVAPRAENIPETTAVTAAQEAPVANHVPSESKADDVAPEAAAVVVDEAEEEAPASGEEPAVQLQPTLEINRPAQNEITMTIGGQTVALRAEQIGQLIEELSNARASMTPEPPPGIPPGWRFVSTKNPVMAVQKQSNGDRLLVMRHTGHGWVPFTFSPDMVIQMYMMLTKG